MRFKIKSVGCIRRFIIDDCLQEDSGHYVCETSDERNHCETHLIIKGLLF